MSGSAMDLEPNLAGADPIAGPVVTMGHEDRDVPTDGLLHYRAYGLTIASDVPLVELQPVPPAAADLTFTQADIDRPMPVEPGARISAFTDDEIYFGWNGIGRFLMTRRRTIRYMPAPGLDAQLLSMALLGPLLGLVLEGRGLLVLHGSGLVVDGRAALFLGDKGAGKSTTAAAFIAAGHRVLADDLLAVDVTGDRPRILGGYPAMKLSPEAADILAPPIHRDIPIDFPGIDKRRVRIDDCFSGEGVEIGAVYLLERGDPLQSIARTPQEGLVGLIRFSYATRFGDAVIRGAAAAAHFRQCAQVASVVPTRTLRVPDDLARLPAAVRFVEAEFRTELAAEFRGDAPS